MNDWPSKKWKYVFRNPALIWWLFVCHEMDSVGSKSGMASAAHVIVFFVVFLSPWWVKDKK